MNANDPISRRRWLKQNATAATVLVAADGRPTSSKKSATQTKQAPSALSSIEQRIDELLAVSTVPGLSLAVIEDGEVAWRYASGVANIETGRKMSEHAIFQAASLTKPVFAYVVLKLCELGRFSLDTPLKAYAPDVIVSADPRADRMTARMALAHTTGLPNWANGKWPLELDAEPGARFGYSGEAYVYLQKAVEQAESRPLVDIMQDMIGAPFGLNETSFVWRDSFDETAALGYEWDNAPVKLSSRPTEASGAASMHTTASDYARFVIAVLNAEPTGAHRLSYLSSRMMLSPQVGLTSSLAWGLGWGLHLDEAGDRFWHFGDSRGYMSYVIASRKERRGLVVFTNGRHGLRLAHRVADLILPSQSQVFSWIYDVFYEGELPDWPPRLK